MVCTTLNLAYSKEYMLFIRLTYGEYNIIVPKSSLFFYVTYDCVIVCDSYM